MAISCVIYKEELQGKPEKYKFKQIG